MAFKQKNRKAKNTVSDPVHIIDLFSGPGGLGEGFSSVRHADGSRAYRIEISIEKDRAAHQTLRLRAFLRQFEEFPSEYYAWIAGKIECPDWQSEYPREWQAAEREAIRAELGQSETTALLSNRIAEIRRKAGDRTLLIGGPPCQAYSLAGRSRNAGNQFYKPKNDGRHFLYKEYCRVLSELNPAAFVMENVKGMLSSSVEGMAIFERVMCDLEQAGSGYRLIALSSNSLLDNHPEPRDFIVRSEEHGVPQSRHRVIIVGIRSDLSTENVPKLGRISPPAKVKDVLVGLPRLRSGLSKSDSNHLWYDAMVDALELVNKSARKYVGVDSAKFMGELGRVEEQLFSISQAGRQSNARKSLSAKLKQDLAEFIDDPLLVGVSGHATRGHMPSDLARYLYAACFAKAESVSPRAHEFPATLAPNHRNWHTGKFNDRFRVQVGGEPASTITSHISKDGHYFIHHEAAQCRSLTVRESARLQSFPDNYQFLGNRTEQYVQVGNAVPPFLASKIGATLLELF